MGGGQAMNPSSFCGICGKEMRGPWGVKTCTVCGMRLCTFCVRKIGGFLGFGGRPICPYCKQHVTKK